MTMLERTTRPATSRAPAGQAAVAGVAIKGETGPRYEEILTPAALRFLAELHRRFEARRCWLIAERAEQQKRYDTGALPDFTRETTPIREANWTIAPIPRDLLVRRVEITGPVDRKMIINALNSGANVF